MGTPQLCFVFCFSWILGTAPTFCFADTAFSQTAVYFANAKKPQLSDINRESSWAGKCVRTLQPDVWQSGLLSFFRGEGTTVPANMYAVVSFWEAASDYAYSFTPEEVQDSRSETAKQELKRTDPLSFVANSLATCYRAPSGGHNFVFLRKSQDRKRRPVWVYRSLCYLAEGCTQSAGTVTKWTPYGQPTAYCYFDHRLYEGEP